MSQEEINKRIGKKLIKRIRGLPDQEIINLYNDAISFRTIKQMDLQKILQAAQLEVVDELRKEKLEKLKAEEKKEQLDKRTAEENSEEVPEPEE